MPPSYPLKVIGIIHKDPETPYGVSFPGLPSGLCELSDDFPHLKGEIDSLLIEYFSNVAEDVEVDTKKERQALAQTHDSTNVGHSESLIDHRHGKLVVLTALYHKRPFIS